MKNWLLRSLAMFFCLTLNGFETRDASAAELRYNDLSRVLRPAKVAQKYDRLRVSQQVRSKIVGVSANQIRLEIHPKSGTIVLPVAHDGEIKFPFQAALEIENPVVVTNQPRGSLTLSTTIEIRPPASKRWVIQEFDLALQQARLLITELSSQQRPVGISGAAFEFPKRTSASVTSVGRFERFWMADADGQIVISMQNLQEAKATEIVFSNIPSRIIPYVGEATR